MKDKSISTSVDVFRTVYSLFRPEGPRPFKNIYCKTDPKPGIQNYDEQLLDSFNAILSTDSCYLSIFPYWDNASIYSPKEVFLTAIQFFDDHSARLPLTTLPPASDIELYCKTILLHDRPVTVDRQFRHLLDISQGNIVGAGNLGMMASRLYCRGADFRAYHSIHIEEDKIIQWRKALAPFEVYNGLADISGDTYYFWTHFFTTTVLGTLHSYESRMTDKAFIRGTDIMRVVRKYIAGNPTITSHHEASMLGRNIGLMTVNMLT